MYRKLTSECGYAHAEILCDYCGRESFVWPVPATAEELSDDAANSDWLIYPDYVAKCPRCRRALDRDGYLDAWTDFNFRTYGNARGIKPCTSTSKANPMAATESPKAAGPREPISGTSDPVVMGAAEPLLTRSGLGSL